MGFNFNCNFSNSFLSYRGKLQITLLKFGDVWILHPEISNFGFYPLKFRSVWILHPDVLEFRFYPPKVWGYLDFTL